MTKHPWSQLFQQTTWTIPLLISFLAWPTLAQFDTNSVTPLKESDRRFMNQQRSRVDTLARRHLGMWIRGQTNNDLIILQKLLDQHLAKSSDKKLLQAMGVVLGDLYVRELGVHWVIYRDKHGRSRALQWKSNEKLLFPVTMISRRVEAGIQVDVKSIHQKGLNILRPLVKQARD